MANALKKTLAEHVIDVMKEHGYSDISGADIEILAEAYARSAGRVKHPLERNKAAMAAVRRSDLFVQDGVIRANDSLGRQAKLSTFRIKDHQA